MPTDELWQIAISQHAEVTSTSFTSTCSTVATVLLYDLKFKFVVLGVVQYMYSTTYCTVIVQVQ
jgi:hypothetical protein